MSVHSCVLFHGKRKAEPGVVSEVWEELCGARIQLRETHLTSVQSPAPHRTSRDLKKGVTPQLIPIY